MKIIKNLFFFTAKFPFGNSETFIENEIWFLAKRYEKVYIFPVANKGQKRSIPKNCEVVEGLFTDFGYTRKRLLYKYSKQVCEMFFSELRNQGKFNPINNKLLSQCLRIAHKASLVDDWLTDNRFDSGLFYSYWMSDWTTILSVLKSGRRINNIITRAHGFDLFEERQENGFIPWRRYQIKHVNKIYSVSKMGSNYLQKNYPAFKSKIKTSYLGTSDHGKNRLVVKNELHLVSISNIIPLKRLHLIVEILKKVTVSVKWTHFGDGEKMKKIVDLTKFLSKNIRIDFKGRISNKEIMQFLKENPISFFINVSESEGLPVSIMEAISFGIPVIATDVGGSKEIVNNETGLLIEKDFNTDTVSETLNNYISSKYATPKFRAGVREFWQEKFNAKKNYTSFIRKING